MTGQHGVARGGNDRDRALLRAHAPAAVLSGALWARAAPTTPGMQGMHPIMPTQYLTHRDNSLGEPQRRLMLAVLRTALEDCTFALERGGDYRRRPLAAERQRAAAFLASRDRSWPFSFENICEATGLDADAIRRRFTAVCDTA